MYRDSQWNQSLTFCSSLSAERREALKAELERLTRDPTGQKKPLSAPGPSGPSASKGSVTLQELRLPLKADFVCSIANKPGTLGEREIQDYRALIPAPLW